MPLACTDIQSVRSIPWGSNVHVFILAPQNTIWAENMGMFIYIFVTDIGVLILFFFEK